MADWTLLSRLSSSHRRHHRSGNMCKRLFRIQDISPFAHSHLVPYLELDAFYMHHAQKRQQHWLAKRATHTHSVSINGRKWQSHKRSVPQSESMFRIGGEAQERICGAIKHAVHIIHKCSMRFAIVKLWCDCEIASIVRIVWSNRDFAHARFIRSTFIGTYYINIWFSLSWRCSVSPEPTVSFVDISFICSNGIEAYNFVGITYRVQFDYD